MAQTTATLSLDTIVRRRPDVLATEVNGEVVIMCIDTGSYYGLDAVGSFVWQALEAPGPVVAICDRVQDAFDVDEAQCRRDVLALLASMQSNKLVQLA